MKVKTAIFAIIILLFSIVGVYELKTYGYFEKSNLQIGSTTGNVYNIGIATEDKNYIYFSNYDENGKLYKMDKKTRKSIKLCDDIINYINISHGYIYYSNLNDGEKIYKIKTDGKQRKKLSSCSSEYIKIRGNYIYYSNVDDDGCLYKMRIDGKKNRKILNLCVQNFNIANDKIYYVKNKALYSMTLNGHLKKRIYKGNEFKGEITIGEDFQIINNNIYFSNASFEDKNRFLCKANLNDFKFERLTDENIKDVNVYGNYIYYVNEFDSDSLYAMKIDGSNRKKIKEGPISKINIVENGVFYFNDVHNEIYRMNLKTKVKEKVSKSSPSSAIVYNGSVIYTTDIKKDKRRGSLNFVTASSKKEKMLSYIEDGWQKVLKIDNDWIYFIRNINYKEKIVKKLYRVRLDGSKLQEVSENFDESKDEVKDDFIYSVVDVSQNKFVFTKEKIGSNQCEKLMNYEKQPLNKVYSNTGIKINYVEDGYIYYSINYELKDSKLYSHLYKFNLKKKSNEIINKDKIINLLKFKKYIYYNTLSDLGTLYSMNLNGNEKNKILDGKSDNIYLLTIKDGWIYYKRGTDGNRLYRVKVNGGEKQKILNKRDIYFIGVDKDYIYYEYASKENKQFFMKNTEF